VLPSLGTVPGLVADIGIAAYTSHQPQPQTVDSSQGLVAVPVPGKGSNSVFVYSVNFSDVAADVLLIRHRILIAALIALAVVLLLGTLVARALTVRVLRLERAAQRVAQGDLTAQFEDDSSDEIGQLAAALAHMQSQLQELEQARRRFIATASHELRTPIFSLGGFLELIQDEELDEETRRQFVGQVREQVERLGKLATGLLDLSRLEAGSVDLEPTPTDLGVLSRAVAAEFVPALALHDSELDLQLPETPLRAVVDPDRVAQLLRILIDNAITHTPPGTPVTVGVGNGDGMVRLSVADGGPGIPDEVVGRIFEPFYSADGVQGAGLGLAIARELAERLRGSLDVRSAAAATVFTLTLPGEPT
jgi:signal transduction histidine kinase